MLVRLQRAIARVAAISALILGAVAALFLAAMTLAAGLVIGLVATLAAWFGLRARRRAQGVPGAGGPAADRFGPRPERGGTVIDVEMREISSGNEAGKTDAADAEDRRRAHH
jgi:hypothetical protein